MGACVSTPENCVQVRRSGWKRKRRKQIKPKVPSRFSHRSFDAVDKPVAPDRRSFNNPPFPGSTEEAFFDSAAILDSDCDEDFQSVQDDMQSLNCFEGAFISSVASHGEGNHGECSADALPTNKLKREGEASTGNSACNSVSEVAKNSTRADDADSRLKSLASMNEGRQPTYWDEVSSVDEGASREERLLNNCGILPNNCLPCLASTVPTVDKRRSLSSSPLSARKKASFKLSFKWREGNSNGAILSSKMLLQRPIAGSQLLFCPAEKKMLDSWSRIDPSTFKVRAKNYLRDKKKDFAPNHAAYYPFGVDVFLSPRKIDHIARFVELPLINSSEKLPSILVVNAQVPLYPASLFQSETDGEGMNIVLYFKLSDSYSTELPSHFKENFRRLVDDEVEKVKSFPIDTIIPFRERLKILGRFVNVDELHLGAAERKLIHAYNEKPVLTRPQHQFFLGENYLEIDLDMHRFSYISRKGFEVFMDRLKNCILDFGLTIQGNKAEELPEQILCCVRLNGIDYINYQQLGLSQEPLEQS